MRGRFAALAAALVVASLLTAPGAAAGHEATQRVRVMSLNVFYGGDELDLETGDFCAEPDGCVETLRQVERLIRRSGADIVGVQETERNTERIAAAIGWYGSNHAHVMSRFPIIDPPGADGRYVFVVVAPGRVVAVANTHLPSDPYGPYLVRDGGTRAEVLALERQTRLPAIRDLVRVLPGLAARGIPVLLTGDFNSPSHLDWTPAVAAARPEVPYAVRWPASAALADAGLVDTYREAHPDPVAVPGFTWTPGGPESDPAEVHDRIDWVLRAGPSRTVDSKVVGEVGGPDVGVGLSPYPSDHRGVVSTVDVTPAVPPVLVAPASRSATIGSALDVAFHAPGWPGERVTLRDERGRLVGARMTGTRDGEVRFGTRGLARGRYEVALESGGRVLSRTAVWLYPAGEPAKVFTDQRTYRVGERIGIDWTNAPGMGLDWISLFRCPDRGACDDTANYLVYDYTGGAIEGGLTLGPQALEGNESWPLPRAGTWLAYSSMTATGRPPSPHRSPSRRSTADLRGPGVGKRGGRYCPGRGCGRIGRLSHGQ
ncbi:hypothetical protein Pflav_072750 [Phytohabitans flavus]|uniref:Endonuclease/exonuclease/phosphatase domain-containing protein n=1 Tax=Phytohabitans flavus TaxID=1076124 RepID=A0A6F8Y439_9ACTN|nr:endonuclease/exonuclease/phosphatase family protein [Phytohabitans flavus]BCB80865.1 hypothetical protein Pflav_072750 [Phytohabitans flavus]